MIDVIMICSSLLSSTSRCNHPDLSCQQWGEGVENFKKNIHQKHLQAFPLFYMHSLRCLPLHVGYIYMCVCLVQGGMLRIAPFAAASSIHCSTT